MSTSKAQQKAVNKYIKDNYDRVNLTLPKGMKEALAEHASARNETLTAFIKRAIDEQFWRDVDESSPDS